MSRTQEPTAGSGATAAATRGGSFDEPRAGDGPGDGTGAGDRTPAHGAAGLPGRHVCPFCGSVNDAVEGPCPRCTMENTAETRKATKSRIGPWYVLQSRNPAAPGMTHDTLLGFVRKGRVKARSIVRGPTTHQLWRFACQVRGLSREFGVCYSCGGVIARDTHLCPQCNRPQDPPADPDVFLEGQPVSGAGPSGPTVAAPLTSPAPAAPLRVVAAAVTPGVVSPADERRTPVYRELKIPTVAVGDDIVVPPLASAAMPGAAAVAAPPPAAQTPPANDARPAEAPHSSATPTPEAPRPAQEDLGARPPADTAPAAPATPTAPAGRRKANDVFLSAKDLAAAFQLDFKPDADAGPAGAESAYSRPVAAGDETPLPWPPRRRRKRHVGRYVLVLLLLAAGGFGAAVALSPSFRQQTVDWANAKYQSLTGANLYPDIATRPRAATGPVPATTPATPPRPSRQQVTGPRPSTPTPTVATPTANAAVNSGAPGGASGAAGALSPGVSVAGSRGPGEDASTPRPPAQPAPEPRRQVTAPRQAPTPAAGSVSPVGNDVSTEPAGVDAPPRAAARGPDVPSVPDAKGAPATTRAPAAATRPVAATQPAPAPAPAHAPAPAPAPPKLTLQEAQQRAKAWYGQALDADADGDLAKATKLYKRIMDELPAKIDGQDVWPSDVKLRYDEAAASAPGAK